MFDDKQENLKKTKLEDPRKTSLSQNHENSGKTASPLVFPAGKIVAYKVKKESDDKESEYKCDYRSSNTSNSENED